MSSEPYLVAHLVRGQPAFDIAIKLQIGDEEGWIIPTSGHRAYPYWDVKLDTLFTTFTCFDPPPPPPSDWPDHYEASPAPKGQGTALASSLLERLGLLRKATIRRR